MKIIQKVIIIIMIPIILTACGNESKNESITDSVSVTDNQDSVGINTESSEGMLEELRGSTVMIYAGERHGTGVIIGNDGNKITIATVAHLMKEYEQGIVMFYSGKTGFADVSYIDTASDICIMTMNNSDFADDYGEQLKPVLTDRDKIQKLNQYDSILLLGSAVNVAANATVGEIGSTDYFVPEYSNNMIYLYADAMPGMSGSGCYTEDGYLIGILSSASDNEEVLCVKINDYLEILDSME